jgi:hypothetical protein
LNFTNFSMQINAEFKEEQIGTLFVWVGALEGGGRGGGGAKGGPIQKIHVTYSTFFFPPSCTAAKKIMEAKMAFDRSPAAEAVVEGQQAHWAPPWKRWAGAAAVWTSAAVAALAAAGEKFGNAIVWGDGGRCFIEQLIWVEEPVPMFY